LGKSCNPTGDDTLQKNPRADEFSYARIRWDELSEARQLGHAQRACGHLFCAPHGLIHAYGIFFIVCGLTACPPSFPALGLLAQAEATGPSPRLAQSLPT